MTNTHPHTRHTSILRAKREKTQTAKEITGTGTRLSKSVEGGGIYNIVAHFALASSEPYFRGTVHWEHLSPSPTMPLYKSETLDNWFASSEIKLIRGMCLLVDICPTEDCHFGACVLCLKPRASTSVGKPRVNCCLQGVSRMDQLITCRLEERIVSQKMLSMGFNIMLRI